MTTMEAAAAAAMAVVEEETAVTTSRIFLGGLGVSVTEDDLRSAFSSLGSISSVQIIRDKGRNLAYFDFLPSSEKSLSKLFSTYNGCVWKGGRLRLEKAKEHYKLRMQREWMEDAKHSIKESIDIDDTPKIMSVPNKKKLLKEDQPVLRIFFPCFRKVKLLPGNGTGKHKYSFQRVNVPSLPVHFCDCEEHSGSVSTAKQEARALEVLDGGVDEQEFSIMHNVMNKLFAKQNNLGPINVGNELVKGQHSISFLDKHPVDKNVTNEIIDDDVDIADDNDDDFVMNLSVGQKDQMVNLRSTMNRTILQNKASEEKPVNVASTTNERSRKRKSDLKEGVEMEKNSSTISTCDLVNDDDNILINVVAGSTMTSRLEKEATLVHQVSKKAQTVELPNKKRKSSTSESNEAVVSVAKSKTRWNERLSIKPDQSFGNGLIDLSSNGSNPSVGGMNDNLTNAITGRDQSTTITSDNAALTQEVSNIGETEVSENMNPEDDEQINQKSNEPTTTKTGNSGRGVSWLKKSSWNELVSGENSSFSITHILPTATFTNQEPLPQGITGLTNTTNIDQHSKPTNSATKKRVTFEENEEPKGISAKVVPPVISYKIGETCPFMRSDSSMKEWKKAKAVLSGSLKKKGNGNEK